MKQTFYQELLKELRSLLVGEEDLIANLSNTVALLKEKTGHHWIGYYLVKGEELVLGPFQGPVACTRIKWGKGVCGTSWKEEKTYLVPDVEEFPGHIACSSLSRSELVVPLWKNNQIIGILDIDSAHLNAFDAVDKEYMEAVNMVVSAAI